MTTSQLHVVDGGAPGAARVVLVHGSMDRSSTFGRVGRHLGDLHVVRYDRRGYGRSRRAGEPTGIDGHVDDLLEVVGDAPAVVAGHSFGGVVALTAASRRPDRVVAVVAWEAPMPWRRWWPDDTPAGAAIAAADQGGLAEAAEAFMARIIGADRWAALPERTKRDRRPEGAALVTELLSLRQGAPYDPAAVTVPVVAAHGGRTRPQFVRAAQTLVEECPGAELVVVDGADHGAHLSHPAEFAAVVRRAVARAEA